MQITPALGILAVFLAIAPTDATARGRGTAEERFFASIDRGDVAGVFELLHPAARKLVDAPVLEAWMDAISKNLGEHERIQVLDRKVEQRLTGRREETRSEVTFVRGTAESAISVLDGQIIAFQVTSARMANWFQGPTTAKPYAAMAEEFVQAFLNSRVTAARELMHPALRMEITLDRLEEMIRKVRAHSGPLRQITLRDRRFSLEGTTPALFLTYDVECEQAKGVCEIEIQFVGMQGHLLGFQFR